MPVLFSVIGLSFWFYSAPDPRFGWGFLYSILFILQSLVIYSFLTSIPKKAAKKTYLVTSRIKKISITIIAFVVLICFYTIIFYSLFVTGSGIHALTDLNFPNTTLQEVKTNEGYPIHIPTNADQCWNGPLPNTPYFNNTLKVEVSNATSLPWMFWYEDKNSLPSK